MGNSRDTPVVQHNNKTMHVMPKPKITNGATKTR